MFPASAPVEPLSTITFKFCCALIAAWMSVNATLAPVAVARKMRVPGMELSIVTAAFVAWLKSPR